MKNDDYYDKLDRSEKRSSYEEEKPKFDSDLTELIYIANEGLKAEYKLLTKYITEIQRQAIDKTWFDIHHNPYGSYNVYRAKPKATLELFYVGKPDCCSYDPNTKTGNGHTGPCSPGKYLVKISEDSIWIGDNNFSLKHFKDALKTIQSFSTSNQDSFSLHAYRDGPGLTDRSGPMFSWKDADRILEAICKARF